MQGGLPQTLLRSYKWRWNGAAENKWVTGVKKPDL